MDEHIDIIMRQTNYSREECIEKLKTNNMNDIIKEYLGISKQPSTRKKSLQQEIYYQIRNQMDSSAKEFNKKQNEKLEKEINDLHNSL
jgi:NACalpha-BTF3-like transcription factor